MHDWCILFFKNHFWPKTIFLLLRYIWLPGVHCILVLFLPHLNFKKLQLLYSYNSFIQRRRSENEKENFDVCNAYPLAKPFNVWTCDPLNYITHCWHHLSHQIHYQSPLRNVWLIYISNFFTINRKWFIIVLFKWCLEGLVPSCL